MVSFVKNITLWVAFVVGNVIFSGNMNHEKAIERMKNVTKESNKTEFSNLEDTLVHLEKILFFEINDEDLIEIKNLTNEKTWSKIRTCIYAGKRLIPGEGFVKYEVVVQKTHSVYKVFHNKLSYRLNNIKFDNLTTFLNNFNIRLKESNLNHIRNMTDNNSWNTTEEDAVFYGNDCLSDVKKCQVVVTKTEETYNISINGVKENEQEEPMSQKTCIIC